MTNRKVLDVAKYVIDKCSADGHPISNLQLQKILYYIQAYFLKNTEQSFFEEDMEAWQFGPVAPSAYSQYCGFGSLPIKECYPEIKIEMTEAEKAKVDQIIMEKREKKPWELVAETHQDGMAWSRTFSEGRGIRETISKELIKRHG